jgi:hypothetical protein
MQCQAHSDPNLSGTQAARLARRAGDGERDFHIVRIGGTLFDGQIQCPHATTIHDTQRIPESLVGIQPIWIWNLMDNIIWQWIIWVSGSNTQKSHTM